MLHLAGSFLPELKAYDTAPTRDEKRKHETTGFYPTKGKMEKVDENLKIEGEENQKIK